MLAVKNKKTNCLSKAGFLAVRIAMQTAGFSKTHPEWEKRLKAGEPRVSTSTWRRFYSGIPVRRKNFIKCCEVLGLEPEQVQEVPTQPELDIAILAQEILEQYGEGTSLRIASELKRLVDEHHNA